MRTWFVVLAVLAALAGAAWWYFSSGLNHLPDWYLEEQTVASQAPDSAVATPPGALADSPAVPQSTPVPETVESLRRRLDSGGEVRLTEADLREVIMAALEARFPGRSRAMVPGLHPAITPGKVELEAVLNPREIPWEQLPPDLRVAREFLGQLGASRGNELFVKISGTPVVDGDRLVMGDNTMVQFGKVAFPLNALLFNAGDGARERAAIPLTTVPFSSFRLEEGAIVLLP